ncbi:hypothetical protein DFH27DRAFT_542381 [Peziza echinospora]|nr:hypothetical protein DFH27DRAFT_542381 [Peziza echinospora]
MKKRGVKLFWYFSGPALTLFSLLSSLPTRMVMTELCQFGVLVCFFLFCFSSIFFVGFA